MTVFRLSWETVARANREQYTVNDQQMKPNSEIPDCHWYTVREVTSHPWRKLAQFRQCDDNDHGFIRRVRLDGKTPWGWDLIDRRAEERLAGANGTVRNARAVRIAHGLHFAPTVDSLPQAR